MTKRREARTISLALAFLAGLGSTAEAIVGRPVNLRGSKASIAKMHTFATRHRYEFFRTASDVDSAVARGRLVALTGSASYEVSAAVGFAYSTPEARAFVEQLAPHFVAKCGEPMVVTSATRPESRQPRNASEHSVHPTGIAIDLRRPAAGPCLNWLRDTLSTLEENGHIEVTEERRPPHFHIAVLAEPGSAPIPGLIHVLVMSDSSGAALFDRLSESAPSFELLFQAPLLPSELFATLTGEEFAPATEEVIVLAESAGDIEIKRDSAVKADTVEAAEVKRPRTHKVRSGDTLWDIARKYDLSVGELQRANNLGKRSRIKPKMVLKIPG